MTGVARPEPTGRGATNGAMSTSIGQLLETIAKVVGVKTAFKVDESLWRPTDVAQVIDTARIKSLGWRPEIPIEKTIQDMAGFLS